MTDEFQYSEHYCDDEYEYRHVIVPSSKRTSIPHGFMSEPEWREFGLQMSSGWVHYARHKPEPHVLLFRRALQK